MRRALLALTLALVAAGTIAATAMTKEANVQLSSTPAGIHPGEPWHPVATVYLEGDRLAIGKAPTLTTRRLEGGATRDFQATPTGEPGKYAFEVVFPESGRYSYKVFEPNTGGTYPFPTVLISDAGAPADQTAPKGPQLLAASAGDDSFPLWPVLGGILPALAAAGLAVTRFRVRRSQAAAAVR